MKSITLRKFTFWLLLTITCLVLLANCAPGRWVPGNAKHFQQRHDLKLKRQAAKDSATKKL